MGEDYHLHVENDLADTAPPARPGGIRILGVICFILAVYLALAGGLVSIGTLPLASGRYVLGEYAVWGPAIYWLVAAVFALVGVGLLRRWKLARRLAIVAAALMMATSVLPISAAVAYFQIMPLVVHGLKIILAVMAIRYLLQEEVVEWFRN